MASMFKPHIYYKEGYWHCSAVGGHGQGGNPRAAYAAYQHNCFLRSGHWAIYALNKKG